MLAPCNYTKCTGIAIVSTCNMYNCKIKCQNMYIHCIVKAAILVYKCDKLTTCTTYSIWIRFGFVLVAYDYA